MDRQDENKPSLQVIDGGNDGDGFRGRPGMTEGGGAEKALADFVDTETKKAERRNRFKRLWAAAVLLIITLILVVTALIYRHMTSPAVNINNNAGAASTAKSGTPCPCPYDLDISGRLCGKRSKWYKNNTSVACDENKVNEWLNGMYSK